MGKELEAKTQKETAKIIFIYRNVISIMGKPEENSWKNFYKKRLY